MQERHDTPATALWIAAANGDRETVARLLAEGVDVNVWDRRGRTALSFAAGGNHLDIALDLLRAGAWIDPHEDGDAFTTPLIAAAERQHHDMAVLLLKHGANPTHRGGVPVAAADFYARSNDPKGQALSAMLQKAEDEWRTRTRVE